MIGLLKRSRPGRVRGPWGAPAALLTVLALALGGCTAPLAQAPDKVVTASLPDGAEVSVVFTGHSDLNAKVEPQAVTPDMTAALPTPAAHLSNVAEFALTEGTFPESGALVSFVRKTPPPSGSFSLIAHWNEQDKTWEPVKTQQSEDGLTLTATVTHFSSYTIMDFFHDAVAAYDTYKPGGSSENSDDQAGHRVANGVGQWLGAGAGPPECSGMAKPDWADMLGPESITNIVTWCAAGSTKNPGNLQVKVTMNRTYAGYFRTAVDPAVAPEQDLLSYSDSFDSGIKETGLDVGQKGFLDWKAAGAMAVDSGLIKLDGKAGDTAYPVMPLSTYEFEFTKQELLEAWPEIAANNKQLITFETSWQFTLAGLLSGLVDAAVAKDNGEGRIAGLVLAFQINDCAKSLSLAQSGSGMPRSPGDFLSIVNCITAATNNVTKAVAGALLPGAATAAGAKLEARLGSVLDGTTRVFRFVAYAGVGVTLSAAINDVSNVADSDMYLQFIPAGDAIKAFDAAPWAWHTTADKKYQFLYPAGWKVTAGVKVDYPVSGDNLAIVDENGETMSTFLTGLNMGQGQTSMGNHLELEYVPADGLKEFLEGTENRFSYQTVSFGDTWRGHLGVSSFLLTDTRHEWARGFDISGSDPFRIGGSFGRSIDDKTTLAGLSPDLKGLERMKAYAETVEYQKIRTMLESLRDYVPPAARTAAP